MTKDSRSGIRPVWFALGGAVMGMVGLCLLVFVVTAVGLLWIATPRSSDDPQPTAIPTQLEVADVPTQPLVSATPINANIPTQLPIPTAIPTISSSIQSTEAADSVRNYYNLVSQNRYDRTWPLLTDTFKQKFNCCAPNYNYAGYVDWWNSVDHVEFGDVRTVSQAGVRAVVYAEVYYVMNDGNRSSVDNAPYFELIYSPVMGEWQFEDKRATP